MDEFDIYRARAYGGYVETSAGVEDTEDAAAVEFGLNGNVENEWPKRERERSTRRRSFRNISSAELTADESESIAWAPHGGPRRGSERKRTERTRANSRVTVEVDPPSPPTEDHQRSRSWRTGGPTARPNVAAADPGRGAPTGPKGLNRTRTMPARRSASPRRRSPLCQPVIVEPTPESPTSPPGSSADEVGECKIYRVRSFTTKKGGVVVNRGDSIKICNARRASRCDNLLLATSSLSPAGGGGLPRRCSGAQSTAAAAGRSSLQPFHPSPCQIRRSSASCIVAANSVEQPTGLSDDGRGGGSGDRQSRAVPSPRSSCRNIAYDSNQDDSPLDAEAAIAPGGRKASAVRMQSPVVDRTGGFGVHHVDAGDIEETQNEESGFRLKNSPTKANDDDDDDDGEDDDECDDAAGSEEHVYKVAVVGSNGVGKTTLIHQLLTSEYLANKENYQGKRREVTTW